ncbi:hypothetical protein PFISCL1PPCAC_7544, partial [Pristionchus fissidentatus]
ISRLQRGGLRFDASRAVGYVQDFCKNQRYQKGKRRFIDPSVQEENKSRREVLGMDQPMMNQKLQIAQDGSQESLELMEMTRIWRVDQGRINLASAIGMCRHIIEWPHMTIRDAERLFNVDYKKFVDEFPHLASKLNEVFSSRVPEAVQRRITVITSVHSFLLKVSALLDTVTAKRRSGDAVTEIYKGFGEGTVEDAVRVIGQKKSSSRSTKMNGHVQPSIFTVDGHFYVYVCGREVTIGRDEGSDRRALFLLLSFYMTYDLSYTNCTSDLLSSIELMIKFPYRNDMSKTAKGLFDLISVQ